MDIDKYSGGLVGWRRERGADGLGSGAPSSEAVMQGASVDELLVLQDGKSALQAKLSPHGDVDWALVENASKAFQTVVAQSQMASMLKDKRRNELYERAIRQCINDASIRLGRAPVVLDVGAGTGLLSMLAAKAGAETVYAVEQWKVMARIAAQTVEENKDVVGNRIKIMPFHSTDLTVAARSLLPHEMATRADVIVSEILDSALLGEGVLPSLLHAYDNFATPEALTSSACCVPRAATIYGQLIFSPTCSQWHATHDIKVGAEPSIDLARKDWNDVCEMPALPIPVHAGELKDVTYCSSPFTALAIDFTPAGIRASCNQLQTHLVPLLEGATSCNAVLLWWDCTLYGEPGASENTYSTHPDAALTGDHAWQDHWVQCVVPLTSPVDVSTVSECTVVVQSTEMQFCCQVASGNAEVWPSKRERNMAIKSGKAEKNSGRNVIFTDPEPCTCGLHANNSFERRWMLHDTERNNRWLQALSSAVHLLSESGGIAADGAVTPIRAIAFGQNAALAFSLASLLREHYDASITVIAESLEDAVHAESLVGFSVETEMTVVDVANRPGNVGLAEALQQYFMENDMELPFYNYVCAEPFYRRMATQQLWCAFSFFRRLNNIKPILAPNAVVVPSCGRIKALAVRFHNLHKNHGVVESVLGFKHTAFDAAESRWADPLYSYPLWQYPYDACSEACELGVLDYQHLVSADVSSTAAVEDMEFAGKLALSADANAIILWVDYDNSTTPIATKRATSEEETTIYGNSPYLRQQVKFLRPECIGVGAVTVRVGLRADKIICEVQSS